MLANAWFWATFRDSRTSQVSAQSVYVKTICGTYRQDGPPIYYRIGSPWRSAGALRCGRKKAREGSVAIGVICTHGSCVARLVLDGEPSPCIECAEFLFRPGLL